LNSGAMQLILDLLQLNLLDKGFNNQKCETMNTKWLTSEDANPYAWDENFLFVANHY
jgi:hypothetical protein